MFPPLPLCYWDVIKDSTSSTNITETSCSYLWNIACPPPSNHSWNTLTCLYQFLTWLRQQPSCWPLRFGLLSTHLQTLPSRTLLPASSVTPAPGSKSAPTPQPVYWLPVCQCIQFKLLPTYLSLHNPTLSFNVLRQQSRTCHLRSAGSNLLRPITCTVWAVARETEPPLSPQSGTHSPIPSETQTHYRTLDLSSKPTCSNLPLLFSFLLFYFFFLFEASLSVQTSAV